MKESFHADATAVAAYRRRLITTVSMHLVFVLLFCASNLLPIYHGNHRNDSWWLLLPVCAGISFSLRVLGSVVSTNAKTIEYIQFADNEIRIFMLDTRLFGGLYKSDPAGDTLPKGNIYIWRQTLDTFHGYNDEEKATAYWLSDGQDPAAKKYFLIDHLFTEFPKIQELLNSYTQNKEYPSLNPAIAHRRRHQLFYNLIFTAIIFSIYLVTATLHNHHAHSREFAWDKIDSSWLFGVYDGTHQRITDPQRLADFSRIIMQSTEQEAPTAPVVLYHLDIYADKKKFVFSFLQTSSRPGHRSYDGTIQCGGIFYSNDSLWRKVVDMSGHYPTNSAHNP